MSRRPVPEPCDFVRRDSDRALGVVTNHGRGRTFVVRWPDGLHALFRIRHADGELEQISPPPVPWQMRPELEAWIEARP